MCGFIGKVSKVSASLNSDDLRDSLSPALRFLSRRGPDSSREWRSSDGRAGLLHVRLAIADTDSRANQPFTDADFGITVAFNGEIYNYLELRNELTDFPLKTVSDTEVILALYALHGLEGLNRLRGMFAIAIVDERAKRVYLVRDSIGKKPLYIARFSNGTYFGSTLLALVCASGESKQVRPEVLEDFWEDGHLRPNDAVLADCSTVLPG